MILRYSFCRVADDLVDDASDVKTANEWIEKLATFLDYTYAAKSPKEKRPKVEAYVKSNFPTSAQAALLLLPTHLLSYGPLYDLLEGFKSDLKFHSSALEERGTYPIHTEQDLELYGLRVAGTVAELCLELVFHYTTTKVAPRRRDQLVRAGGRMGIALQYINIARDIATDASISRVYLPTSWLEEEGLTPSAVIKTPDGPSIEALKNRLLKKAFMIYEGAIKAVEQLPVEARAPMRVAVESYMEIGRVLRGNKYQVKAGRATVPKMRRIRVAWNALKRG
jgi:15-cis-phytoene synthase/lycopene beta-cyclase